MYFSIFYIRFSQIYETDNWPKFICRQCLDTANICLEFISTIRESESKLQNIYGDLRDFDRKPDFEIIDIKTLPELKDELESNEPKEETTLRRRSLRTTQKESCIKTLSKKEAQPQEQETSEKNVDRDGDSSPMLHSPEHPALPSVQNNTSEDEESEEEGVKVNPKKLKTLENIKKIEEFFKMDCNMCDQSYTTLGDLRSHYRIFHKRTGYVVCCNVKLKSQSRILQHLEFHMNPDAFKCIECAKTFKNKVGLELHTVNSHTPKEQHKYKCPKCPKTFMSAFRMNAHSAVHATGEDYICPHCSKAFPAKLNLSNHIRNMHEEKTYDVCEICAKKFKYKSMFLRHQKLHTGEKVERNHSCPVCGNSFRYKCHLETHMERHNDSGQVFQCHICSKVSANKSALQQHIKYNHIREKKHKCNLCESAFKTPLGLREHMATHTSNQILYTCLFCPRQFNSKANKYAHQKRKHPDKYEAMKQKEKSQNFQNKME